MVGLMNRVLALFLWLVSTQALFAQDEISPKTKKYVNHTEFGFLFGQNGEFEDVFSVDLFNSISIKTFHGYRFHRLAQVGLSTGLDVYPNVLFVPVMVGVRGDITAKAVSPFYGLDLGYGFAKFEQRFFDDDFNSKGGFMYNPVFGLRFRLKSSASLSLALGYQRTRGSYEYQFFDPITQELSSSREEIRIFNRLTFRFGFSF